MKKEFGLPISVELLFTLYTLKWDVKNGIAFFSQFFSLISDGLGGVSCYHFAH